MTKKIYFSIIFFFLTISYSLASSSIFIIASVDDEIITNYDLKKESEYLKILNPSLNQLDDAKILDLAKNSLVNEIIKKKELIKFVNLDDENPFVDDYLQNLFLKLDYRSKKEFENDLSKKKNYSLNEIKKKIKIELMWNELIYNRYKNQVKIDKNDIVRKVNNLDNRAQKEYFLSEIIFEKKKDISLENLHNEILLSINDIGFNNSANIYSISESAKLGGKLGWVNENSLSKMILKELNLIDKGQFTKMIKIGNNFLLLKIDDIRDNEIKIDKQKEIEKLIKSETNKQLNQFSRIYFDKSKINYSINEY